MDDISDVFKSISSESEPSGSEINSERSVPSESSSPPPEDMVIIRDGDREIPIPRSGKVKLSTKAGDEAEISVRDWESAHWSKKENSRLVNDKKTLEQTLNQMKQRYEDLDSILSADPKDLSGPAWTAQALRSMYQLNPERASDIEAFVTAIKNGTLNPNDVEKSEIQRENIKLKQKAGMADSHQSSQQLESYGMELSNKILDSLGIEADELVNKVDNMMSRGELSKANNVQDLHRQATTIYGNFLVDKAEQAINALNLSQEEISKYQQDLVGLLYANPKQSSTDLAKKLGSMIGKNPQGTAPRAKEKVEKFKESTGRRPEKITPKPLVEKDLNPSNMEFGKYFKEKFGLFG